MTEAEHSTFVSRSSWFRALRTFALFAVLFLGVRAWQLAGTAEGQAPAIDATSISGEGVRLRADETRVTLVHFWAPWCEVCRLEEESIQALAQDHRVITIATRSGTPHQIRRYMTERALDFTVVSDPDGRITREWGVSGLPTSFIVDQQGEIRNREVGYTSRWGLILRLLWASR